MGLGVSFGVLVNSFLLVSFMCSLSHTTFSATVVTRGNEYRSKLGVAHRSCHTSTSPSEDGACCLGQETSGAPAQSLCRDWAEKSREGS